MTFSKKKLDSTTSRLLARIAQSELDSGLGEMIINVNRVQKRKRMILPKKKAEAAGDIVSESPIITPAAVHYESLELHRKAICDCTKCELGHTRTKFVYGVGNINADVMFIGEAPGRDEDLKGEPFVGRAGQLLDKILAAIKFSREDIYIANMLKCRPPGNRDPKPEEMEICSPYLAEQIRLVDPKIICALGRISAQALLKTTAPLGKLRKRWHDYQGRLFMVTYHPAALLRFQAYKKDTWEDVQMLRAKYDELMKEKNG